MTPYSWAIVAVLIGLVLLLAALVVVALSLAALLRARTVFTQAQSYNLSRQWPVPRRDRRPADRSLEVETK